MLTEQEKFWQGTFGDLYIDRNFDDFDLIYQKVFGISRTELNARFLSGMDREISILEVGCNIGKQLQILKKAGFDNLSGIEINKKALSILKKTKAFNIVEGSVLDIPFNDRSFDLVFTSGVLIHIHPDDLNKAIDEIVRVSKRYIWGFEYFSETCEEIVYRGNRNKLWKNNFMKLYRERNPELVVSMEKKVKYLESDNINLMYLLEKERKK